MAQTKCKRIRKNSPVCVFCEDRNKRWDHNTTNRCHRFCSFCMKWGHTKLFCYKTKDCKLCGKSGHNPLRCWLYCTVERWMDRAEQLGRCGECLTLFTADEQKCTNCHTPRVYWKPFWSQCTGSQTQTNDNKEKELQNELLLVTVNAQRRIDDQKE